MSKQTILVVDDENIIRELLDRSLTKLGFNVITAGSGEEALDIFQNHPDTISLVILDYFMPYMNGWEAHERIRAIRPDVKTIISSGQPEAKTKLTTLPGVTGILIKPYLIHELRDVVNSALEITVPE